jgi:hypothetical protein
MKRWGIALLAVVLSCVPILLAHVTSPALLQDTDTAVLLRAVRERNAPFSWFAGDWPLANHFYRPVSTLAFEIDNRLYGNNAAGYGWTNAILCVLCVLLLFWFLMEATENPTLSGASAVLFALWHVGHGERLNPLFYLAAVLAGLFGLFRHGFKVKHWLPAVLVYLYLPSEFDGMTELYQPMIGWLPGRTASVMTVFALIAMAAYARYERLSAVRNPPKPSPLEEPATRTTKPQLQRTGGWPLGWALLSVVAVALALGSYEQAVMLPAALFGVALILRFRRYNVRWGWQAAFWLVLIGYLVLRSRLVPTAPSRYQLQQFRHGQGVYYALLDYILPTLRGLPIVWESLGEGFIILMTPQPWLLVMDFVANVTAFYQARRKWIFALGGWALSLVTYLPMAFLNPFGHYHYWPMAMRSMLVITMLWIAYKLSIIAVSPPALQAPQRPSPAPGSLPHP